ncbi:syntaxin-like protein [Phytophthora cinnamomi]|uniref:syntaxin-like protein n=1 Tax=Phytophthora cinnamomi TaxID=4785 RepID=UPI00355A7F4A|nr:syntaxin-like protein [Phytophthora cinnamomi]
MDVEVKQQQALMRSLRVFVDALRGIKKTQDAADVHHDVVEAVRVLCAPSETQDSAQWHDEAWRHGLVPIFQKLCLCMMRLDALEAKERNKVGPKAPRQAEKPKAPAGLLSLRDYSVLQAALELLFCWGAYPRVAAGVLMPIEKRRPTRTFEISKDVLMWGYRGYTRVMLDGQRTNEETTNELLGITQALLQLLSLPQFQPILLPKYVVELLALLVYDAHPGVAIPALVKALLDSSNSLESRIKLSEALLFSAKRCGDTLPKYGKIFVYAYLDCIRPPPSLRKRVERMKQEVSKRVQLIQEVENPDTKAQETAHSSNEPENEQELLAAATLRSSCLSNLAEICALLQWGLQPFVLDVMTCVFGVLQMELELVVKRRPTTADATESEDQQKLRQHREEEQQQRVVAVRRGAVFVLRYLVELLGWKMLGLMPDHLSPLYQTLKHVARVDRDRVVVFHANRALGALDEVMRAELFPRVEQQDAAFGISSLRIL